ncbi:MAG TPA: serine/threonine-protein kinase [Polyangiaceae bacterium]|nr:serine/threonine-protein kinase [Polyangiaceae bacterium]
MSRASAAEPASAAADAWIGKCLDGRYRIEAQLGAGGAGTVYRARHLGLDRAVALKVLRTRERWGSRKRFEREARALAQLSHEHIVAVSDCGVDGEVPYLVMELLEGESLAARLERGALPPELACDLLRQLLEGLAYVHERGLVHRDLKPGNLFLERTAQGRVRLKLLDFGLAKLLQQSEDAAVTLSGEVFGTPAYMPPEQITGESIDARSDVYSVGLVAFEMIAGRRAFQGHEAELLRQQLVEPLPRLTQLRPAPPALLAVALDPLLERATDKDKTRRFAQAREMADALQAALPAQLRARQEPIARTTGAGTLSAATLSGTPFTGTLRARGRRRGSRAGSLLRAGALAVCVIALAAIVVAGGIIYLLDGPEGDSHRVLLRRAIASLWGSSER